MWWNTRVNNATTGGVARHNAFSSTETDTSDTFTSLVSGSYTFGVQGYGFRLTDYTDIYTNGTTDRGAYRYSTAITVP